MIFLKAFVLAVVEGVTEFLPVSSTAHLLLVESLLTLGDDPAFRHLFKTIIQFPAILAVAVYFRRELWPFSGDDRKRRETIALWTKVLLAVVPVGIAGILLNDLVEERLSNPAVIAATLLAGGIIIIWVERRTRAASVSSLADVTVTVALLVGLFQCLALVPGVSRSGATIIGALLLGVDRVTAAKFSFILAIPTMAAATLYTVVGDGLAMTAEQLSVLAFACVIVFAVAMAVVSALMRYIQSHSFEIFGYYRIVLSLLVFAALALGWLANAPA